MSTLSTRGPVTASALLSPVCLLCALCGVCLCSCGVTTTVGTSGQDAPVLHVTFVKPPRVVLDTYIRDAQAVTRLYRAALALPRAPTGVYNCPMDDGSVYHLTFAGDQMTVRHMDVHASGCRFVTFTDQSVSHLSDDAFIALFTKTVGVSSLDPSAAPSP
jgi:hypothetical protein